VEYRVNRGWRFTVRIAADVNLDSSALKDAVVDCSTTWDGSEFQSPTVRVWAVGGGGVQES